MDIIIYPVDSYLIAEAVQDLQLKRSHRAAADSGQAVGVLDGVIYILTDAVFY